MRLNKNASTYAFMTHVEFTSMENLQATFMTKDKKIQCRSNIPIWKAMKENGFSRSAFLTVRDGILITDDEILKAGDLIELIPIVSGG
jgi:sulfur carrier protein ThiS